VVRELKYQGYTNILMIPRSAVDLTDPAAVKWAFSVHEPEYVFHCAAYVGGIRANIDHPVDFFRRNIAIQNNVIFNAAHYKVKKLLFLGSSCIYPRDCPQPIREEYLLTGPLEKSNEAYAIAKIAGVKLCQYLWQERGCCFVSAMPCNLYGAGDLFDPHNAHIIPGLIARMHSAKEKNAPEFDVWGRPDTLREYLYSDDLARALIVVMNHYHDPEPINTGSGFELPVEELARIIASVVGYYGDLRFDARIPAGTPRKLLDNQKLINLGWSPRIGFKHSLEITYEWYLHARQNGLLRAPNSSGMDFPREGN
jgi:GDP-L-fucose synthase